jgi:hypothetical protein
MMDLISVFTAARLRTTHCREVQQRQNAATLSELGNQNSQPMIVADITR